MSAELFDDYLTAPPAPEARNLHEFRLRPVDDSEQARGMVCDKCGQRMNRASVLCPGRKGDSL